MKIENNVLKHYLKNVYFITGTAYAGKSTTVRMLAERYGMIECGESPKPWQRPKRTPTSATTKC